MYNPKYEHIIFELMRNQDYYEILYKSDDNGKIVDCIFSADVDDLLEGVNETDFKKYFFRVLNDPERTKEIQDV